MYGGDDADENPETEMHITIDSPINEKFIYIKESDMLNDDDLKSITLFKEEFIKKITSLKTLFDDYIFTEEIHLNLNMLKINNNKIYMFFNPYTKFLDFVNELKIEDIITIIAESGTTEVMCNLILSKYKLIFNPDNREKIAFDAICNNLKNVCKDALNIMLNDIIDSIVI